MNYEAEGKISNLDHHFTIMKKRLLFYIFIAVSVALSAQPTFVEDSLDEFIEREMKRWNVPGVAVAIIKDSQIVKMKGYGYADIEKKVKVNENTLFQIASNSKAFTGTALCMLEQQKKLSMDDSVNKWLPYFSLKDEYAGKNATIADLLSHKIGFQTFQGDFLNWNCDLSRKEIIENMRNLTPVYSFRESFGYCNAAFLTAGEIIPVACDTSWDDFLKHRIFVPLQMNRTSTQWKIIENDANACQPYTIYDGKLNKLTRANIDNLGPAASINSCVKDLANWMIMQVNNGQFKGQQVISEKALRRTREANTIVNPLPGKNNYFELYGLGWFMKDYHGTEVIWHDGGADGFVTTTCFLPDEKIGIVVLTNTDANGFYSITREMIIDAYLKLPYKNRSQETFLRADKSREREEKELQKLKERAQRKNDWKNDESQLAGTYRNEVYGKITIRYSNGNTEIEFEHHPSITAKLEYLEDNDFLCTYSTPTWGIKKAEVKIKKNGTVEGITLRVNEFVDYMEYFFVKE